MATVNITVSAKDAAGATANAVVTATQAAIQPVSLFTTQTPSLVNQSDGKTSQYELGVKIQSSVAGKITAIRFWKGSAETSGHIGHIWSATGTLLATVNFLSETASGWQVQNLTTPLAINANTTYVVSVGTTNTNYVATNNGLTTSIINSPLSTIVGGNGLFGAVGAFPTQTFQASNYFRDVVFAPNGPPPPPTSPPTVSPATVVVSVPTTSGQVLTTLTATNSPTSWAITAGNGNGYFAIDNTGKITVTAAGVTGIKAGSYSLTVTATNVVGVSMPVVILLNAVTSPQTGFPTLDNTGVPPGTVLTPVTSRFTTTTNNQHFVAMDFQKGAVVQNSGCTFTNCNFSPNNNAAACNVVGTLATGPVFTRCTINGSNDAKGITWGTGQMIACQVLHGGDNVELSPGTTEVICNNVLIQDCYILFSTEDFEPGQHPDCVEGDGGHSNVTLRHNTIINQQNNNSCCTCSTANGDVVNFTLDNNYMVGGNYTLYYGHFGSDPGTWTTGTFTNNHIGFGGFGYVSAGATQGVITISGNVDAFTGVNIDEQVANGG